MTLPERTLKALAAINPDRAKAIVKSVDATVAGGAEAVKRVEVVQVADNAGLIVVGPSRHLHLILFLRLIEIAPCRYILAIPTGTSPDSLEIAVLDLIESLPSGEADELRMLNQLHQHIRNLRRNDRVSKAEILFVRMDS